MELTEQEEKYEEHGDTLREVLEYWIANKNGSIHEGGAEVLDLIHEIFQEHSGLFDTGSQLKILANKLRLY